MGAKLSEAFDSIADLFRGYVIVGVLGLFIVGGFWLWNKIDERGHIPHDKLTTVSSESWSTGEYKSCFSLNIQ